jgi:RalA-binding protein 1
MLGSQLDDDSLRRIAEFLSCDIVQKHDSQTSDKVVTSGGNTPTSAKSAKSPTRETANENGKTPTKEGYLTKRGKNFGGWQTRYFVLDGPQLKYFDMVHPKTSLPSQMDPISAV